jgi:hypothetical protein
VDSPEYKLSIRVAGNTIAPCAAVIVAKGYAVSHYYSESEMPIWDAEKDGRRFSADSAEALLGLIAMWEQRGDDWHIKDDEWASFKRLLGDDDEPADA